MKNWWLWLVLFPIGAVGCSEDAQVESPTGGALIQAQTCDDVLAAVKADAVEKVDLELEAFVNQDYYGGPFVGGGPTIGGFPEIDSSDAPASPTRGGGDEDAPSGFSDTNRQVAEVDEADIIKLTDGGRKLYVIRGGAFYAFDSWPADQTSKVADVEIEGDPIEMFVDGDRAVVFSNVYGVDALDDGDLCYGGGGPEPDIAFDVDIAGPGYCGRSFMKTTVIALDGDAPSVVRELYVDGYYTSSRRHGSIVRAIVQTNLQRPRSVPHLYDVLYGSDSYPETRDEEIARARLWAAAAKAAIDDTTLEQWIPTWGERVDGEVVARDPQCGDFYAPAPGFTDYGMTQVLGINVADEGDATITSVLGSASQVYSNAEVLVLTQPDYAWYSRDTDHDRSAVHRFAVSFDQQRTPYEGSGFVQGLVNDQFSIDERGGVIRLATTRTSWTFGPSIDIWVPPVTHNFVTTMELSDGELVVLGATEALAEGERIFSTRFLGDLAYVVTFRQVDPLFAIDLSDPTALEVLGELKIPGFSDYMHPLGDDHLLTIGRDIDEQTFFDNGTALQIFDVSDPTNPRQAFKALVGDGFSEANHNHKAFNFYADLGVLAFPFVSYENDFSSTLELWDVSIESGFNRRGSVDHSGLVLEDCDGWNNGFDEPFFTDGFYQDCGYLPQVSRGVFVDAFVYSISHGGVVVHAVDDLSAPVATAKYE
ncbi:MAG: beta-propeller domain-containing protein [Myxococcota bacterium]